MSDDDQASRSEVEASIAAVMRSLEDLAIKCRAHGLDPMATIATMMSGRAVVPAPPPGDAELMQQSRDLVDALDRADEAYVNAALHPSFVLFEGGPVMDQASMLAMIAQRTPIAQRTWDSESIVRRDGALMYSGRAREVERCSAAHGSFVHDGWYLLQWVRIGDTWRVQLLTRQRESTERDWWNDTYGEPNRLLVETVRGAKPGVALDLAMGQGRNALYLASQGWKVIGIDGSDEGMRIAREDAVARSLKLELITADIDEWDFGVHRFDLVTMMYAGDHAKWIDKIKASLRTRGVFVVEGWARSPDHRGGFGDGQLADLFSGYDILRDEIVEDAPDWACEQGRLVRFIARKP